MKNNEKYALITAFAALICSADAQNLTGMSLSIGGLNTLGVGTRSAAIGDNNFVQASETLAIGDFNYLPSRPSGGGGSLAVGDNNDNLGYNSLVVGSGNWGEGDDGLNAYLRNSLIVGSMNWSLGANSLIAGTNNQLAGAWFNDDFYLPSNSSLLGSGLISANDNSVVVGKNNAGTEKIESLLTPLFVVGNGSSVSARSNAMEVLTNGNVVVKGVITCARGGDIPMFGE